MAENAKPVVLVVDDEESLRMLYRRALREWGYRVLEAENGRVGLEVFRRERPDLILLDLQMPEVNGLEVLATVHEEAPDTPIVIISGTGVMGDVVRALRLGAWNFILKPIEDLAFLRHVVDQAMERAGLIAENRRYREHLEELVRLRTAELEDANRELAETRLQIIRRLGKAAEYRDNETGKHVIRVGLYAEALAVGLGLDAETVELIRHASPMHDIGKIGVADSILLKPGDLDVDERKYMQRHCQWGREILSPLSAEELEQYRGHTTTGQAILEERNTPLLQMAAEIAAAHHEHWDGSGYPRGLSGEAIPLAARLVAVADVYDALASRRPYKEALPHEECVAAIRELAGTHLDSQVVDAFLECREELAKISDHWGD